MDRLDELEVLLAVVDEGSLAAAARRLRRSPAAVSRGLAALEERVGVRLVERSSRASSSSQAGAELASRARALLADYAEAIEELVDSDRPRGRLRVTAPELFGRMHVAPLVNELLDHHPTISAELMLSDAFVELVREGVDVAVRIGALEDSSLTAVRLGLVRTLVAASPSYLEEHGAPREPLELGRHSLIGFTGRTSRSEWRFGAAAGLRLRPRFLADRADVAIAAARDGRGLVRAFSYQLAEDLAEGRLVRILHEHEPPPTPVHFVYPSRRLMPSRARAFVDLATPRLRALLSAVETEQVVPRNGAVRTTTVPEPEPRTEDPGMADTPFHDGELEVQERLGVRARVHEYAPRLVRAALPRQHRELYASLPMIVVASVSAEGQPNASMLFGRPGFIATPDDGHVRVTARPIDGDPLADRVRVGAPLGMLGIDPRTRRRIRVNGRVTEGFEGGFELAVDQAYGNCPQHIRVRTMTLGPGIDEPLLASAGSESAALDAHSMALISRADAFFIASAYLGPPGDSRHGLDASHRGGAPGFVRVEDERTLLFPDFGGNRFYNTLGNLLRHPPVGLLFVDFERGDLTQVDGRATILWEDPLLAGYRGAERFVRIRVDRVRRFETVVPIHFGAPTPSPNEALVGSWSEAEVATAASE